MQPTQIFAKFIYDDELISCEKYGNGHINVTYLVNTKNNKQYILQKINSNIFKDVDMLMSNIKEVTTFLKNNNNETILMLSTKEGKNYYKDECGDYYRMYEFRPYTITVEKADNLEMVEVAASSFGWFHNKLASFDGSKLGEVIPNFHNTKKRYQDFLDSLSLDKLNRKQYCLKEIEDVKKYEKYYSLIIDGINSGEVKLHVTHNDPKINNALFDSRDHSFRCIIDLDTIMPGSVLYDFGDALRSLMTGDKEDTKDYCSLVCNFDIYEHYLKAYYKEAKNFLTKKEIELLPYAPFLLTMECGMRFLKDYLDGDIYFATHKENHNLDRARTQIHLAQSIFENISKLQEITNKIISL